MEYPRGYQEQNQALSNLCVERKILTWGRRVEAWNILFFTGLATKSAISVTEAITSLEKSHEAIESSYRLGGVLAIGIQTAAILFFLKMGDETRRKIEEVDSKIGSITREL